jgi:hypothetical protein
MSSRHRSWALLLVAAMAWAATGCSESAQLTPACSRPDSDILVLEAQSVPTATLLPCIADLPIGWTFAGSLARNDETTFWLDHDRAGLHAVEVVLRATCDVSSAVEVPASPDQVGVRVYQEPTSLEPAFTGKRYELFEGGCIEYRYSFSSEAEPTLVIESDQALSTVARADLVATVNDRFDLTLCGSGAPPCEG